MSRTTAQKGNVLFMLLMAIALLAAVTFSVTRSNRSQSNVSTETAAIYANSIMHAADSMRSAAQMLVAGGTPPTKFSFQNDAVGGYANTNGATDSNKLFHPSGGGISYKAPDLKWLDASQSSQDLYGQWFFPANVCITGIGTKHVGDCAADGLNNEDIIAVLPYVDKNVCRAIDQKLNITLCSGDPCDIGGYVWEPGAAKFTGSFADGITIFDVSDYFTSKLEGCVAASATGGADQPQGTFHYFKVLVER